jgi:hypothetical protein
VLKIFLATLLEAFCLNRLQENFLSFKRTTL